MVLERYQVGEVIGRSVATVRRARDLQGGGDVAIKFGHTRHLADEFRALRAVDSWNVVQVREMFTDGDASAIVMELCIGSLKDYVRDRGYLNESQATNIERQVRDGVRSFERFGVSHGNISPENVLVRDLGGAQTFPHPVICLADPIARTFDPATDEKNISQLMTWIRTGTLPD